MTLYKTITNADGTSRRVEMSADEAAAFEASRSPTKASLKAYAAARRWAKEMGGMTVGGMPIRTDTEARVKIRELKDNIAAGKLSAPYRFKAVSGWVSINEATLTAVYDAIAQFVDDCFSTEDTVSQAIDAGTITTTAAIDAAFSG